MVDFKAGFVWCLLFVCLCFQGGSARSAGMTQQKNGGKLVIFSVGVVSAGVPQLPEPQQNPLYPPISHWILGLAFVPALLRAAETF